MVETTLIAASVFLLGQGAWIHAKAALSQVLLHRAWGRTLAGERQVRPWPWADTWPVARLRLPSAGGDFIVLAGATGRTLAFGPGHLDGSAAPGGPGNCVLSAHRDTQFACLRRLRPGDAAILETSDGRQTTYRVQGFAVVDRKRRIPDAAPGGCDLTLVTCYPFDAIAPGGPQRYVVRASAGR
ncbi:MAG: class GN sortase [Acidobacteriota bacterium]